MRQIVTKLLCVMLLIPFVSPAQPDEERDTDLIDDSSPKLEIPADQLVSIRFDNVRPLTEINMENVADAYPWISPNGLHLYFTQNGDGGDNLYYTSRKDLYSKFENKQLVVIQDDNNPKFSASLSPDELNIYYISKRDGDHVMHASRKSVTQPFDAPVKVELQGTFDGFISAPSLSPDGNYLYLYNSDEGNKMLVFKKGADDQYSLLENVATDFNISPGQVSKDGEKLLMGRSSGVNHDCSMYFMEKNKENASLDRLTYIKIQNGDDFLHIEQPSISADEKVIVFIDGKSDLWDDNQLYIATNYSKLSSVINDALDSKNFMISEPVPNPVKEFTVINFVIPEKEYEDAKIHIFNNGGQLVKTFELQPGQKSLKFNVSDLADGVYVYKLTTALQATESKRLVVAKN
ncbi:MAG: T9SS type A sorting domain-containing protein [Bacteroidia bacterium]